VVAPVSDAGERAAGSWSSAASDVLAVVLAGCRSIKEMVRKSAGLPTFPVNLGPTCQTAWRGPGAVQVRVVQRPVVVTVQQPVRVLQAVPNTVALKGPHTAQAPDHIDIDQDRVEVSIDPNLAVGLYLGRVDDAQGAGTPFVIYLDGLP
jgi:hypothetical protein